MLTSSFLAFASLSQCLNFKLNIYKYLTSGTLTYDMLIVKLIIYNDEKCT